MSTGIGHADRFEIVEPTTAETLHWCTIENAMPEETRRNILKNAAGVAAALTILKPRSVHGAPANSEVKVGVVGTGRRATRVGGHFAKNDGARFEALADIYDDQLDSYQAAIPAAKEAKRYGSIKALLDTNVDAVYIATPPYLHPEHFDLAVESGKHVLLEKPVAVDPAGVRRFLAAAKKIKPGQTVMVDFQQRWGNDYREAYERVQNGEIGDIRMVRSAWIGSDLPRRSGHSPEQEGVRNWLFYKERSGDIMVEQNCHNIDVVRWFTGVHPVAASGYADRSVRTDIGNIVDSLAVNYKQPDGNVYTHSGNQICGRGGYRDVGEYFFGTKGVLTTSRGGFAIYHEGSLTPTVERKTTGDITVDLVARFVDAVQGKAPAVNMAQESAESTLTAIMGRIAYETEKVLTWDEVLNM